MERLRKVISTQKQSQGVRGQGQQVMNIEIKDFSRGNKCAFFFLENRLIEPTTAAWSTTTDDANRPTTTASM